MRKKIAVVGAGISGLLACKYAVSKGFVPTVFEAKCSAGGLWNCTLQTTRLQTPKVVYQFSDFPWPDSVLDEYPTQNDVIHYIQSYAATFDLIKHIQFNSKVLRIDLQGPSIHDIQSSDQWGGNGGPFYLSRKWILSVQNTQSQTIETFEADFVILCVGRFSGLPNIPDFSFGLGPEAFRGQSIHSMELAGMENERAREFLKGKRVTVVGLQKSALDIAMECSSANGVDFPCTVLYRRAHWHLSEYKVFGISLGLLYLNRLSEFFVHKPNEGLILSLLATLLSPLRWGISKLVESDIKRKHKLSKFGMVPNHSFNEQIGSCLISMLPENFYERVEQGSINLRKASSFSFYEYGIVVHNQDGRELSRFETDIVIFATGFLGDDKIEQIFGRESIRNLIRGPRDSALPLYRECVNPRVPQLAVIGFSESLSNLYTSELRCRWLAELLEGNIKLPSIREMEEDIKKWNEYKKNSSGGYFGRSCIGALHTWYNDQLCIDMGWNPRRKKMVIEDLLVPYGPTDYVSPLP